MTNTRAGRGEEPLLSGLAEDGDIVSLDYEDQDPAYAQSDTPHSKDMPTELRGDTVENSSDRLDSPRSGKSPADTPKKPKQLAPIRIKTKTYKTAVAGRDVTDDDAEKPKPDQTKSLLEKISSQRVQLHNLHDENAVLRGRLESLEERVDHYKGENRELKAILSDNEHELSRAKATVSELQDKEEAILEHITAIGDLLGGRTSRKRSTHQYHLTRRSLGREPSRSRSRERGAGGSGGSGEGEGHAGGSSSDKSYTYTDKNGKKVHRSREIKNFCFEKGLCGICYAHGHTANTCTIRNVKQGLPPGMNR